MAVDIWWYEKRGCWCADVPSNGRRKRKYLGKDENRARAKLYEYMASYYESLGISDGDEGTPAPGDRKGPTVVELSVLFLKWCKTNLAERTAGYYRDGLKHVTRRHGKTAAVRFTAQDLEKVKAEMVDEGYAARTINISVISIKRVYSWAVKQSIIDENPIANVERVGNRVNAPEDPAPKHLSLENASSYIELCRASYPLGDICELLLLTGMRVGEAVRVRWTDVDLESHVLRLEVHKTSHRARSRPRTIPLSDRAVEILSAHMPEDPDPRATVFLNEDGKRFTVNALRCRLTRLQEKHPELKDFSFHKLRHTCATQLARAKVPERVAQSILGHSSTLMTRYYTATDTDEMIEAVERLSDMATPPQAKRASSSHESDKSAAGGG